MDIVLLFTAKYLIFLAIVAAAVYWLTLPRKQKLRFAVFGVITAAVALILAKTGSALYFDPRPFMTHAVTPLYPHAPDNGFPSDHTLLASVIAVTIFMFSKRMGAIFAIIAVLIGASRVVGHIHSPIDIIGSIVFAIIGGVAAYLLTPRVLALISKRKSTAPTSTAE